MNAEELLRSALRDAAEEAQATLTLDDVRREAASSRRRTTWRALVLAAAALLVLVGAPTALLLRQDDQAPSPAPSPAPSSPTSSAGSRLEDVPRGAAPAVAYLLDGVVHLPDGSTTQLPPEATDVAQFTPYHGGWLVLDSAGGLVQYDSAGAVVRQSRADDAALAVSLDQTMTAFQTGDHIRVGIASGMGEGESDHRVLTNGRGLVGFLPDGVVYGALPGSIHVVDEAGNDTLVRGLEEADATSWAGELVGGVTDGGTRGRVVSQATGQTLWTSETWSPRKFSSDGQYVAAVHAVDEASDLAILDSRTGHVVARYSLANHRVSLTGAPLWDGDGDSLLFCVADADGETVLRLDPDGTVVRATDVRPVDESPVWVFATTP